MHDEIPLAVRTVLWSYDTSNIDTVRDKHLIIRQILNFGTLEAVHWMRAVYTQEEIREVFALSAMSEWSPKSLRFWELMLHTSPKTQTRAHAIV